MLLSDLPEIFLAISLFVPRVSEAACIFLEPIALASSLWVDWGASAAQTIFAGNGTNNGTTLGLAALDDLTLAVNGTFCPGASRAGWFVYKRFFDAQVNPNALTRMAADFIDAYAPVPLFPTWNVTFDGNATSATGSSLYGIASRHWGWWLLLALNLVVNSGALLISTFIVLAVFIARFGEDTVTIVAVSLLVGIALWGASMIWRRPLPEPGSAAATASAQAAVTARAESESAPATTGSTRGGIPTAEAVKGCYTGAMTPGSADFASHPVLGAYSSFALGAAAPPAPNPRDRVKVTRVKAVFSNALTHEECNSGSLSWDDSLWALISANKYLDAARFLVFIANPMGGDWVPDAAHAHGVDAMRNTFPPCVQILLLKHFCRLLHLACRWSIDIAGTTTATSLGFAVMSLLDDAIYGFTAPLSLPRTWKLLDVICEELQHKCTRGYRRLDPADFDVVTAFYTASDTATRAVINRAKSAACAVGSASAYAADGTTRVCIAFQDGSCANKKHNLMHRCFACSGSHPCSEHHLGLSRRLPGGG